ncbi:MAG: HupE/UreJ family protein [Burkholderiales bacterium]
MKLPTISIVSPRWSPPRDWALSGGLLLTGTSPAALAHTGHGSAGLAAGLLHPFTGWDHLLAMVAVGLWAAQARQRAAVWWLPAAFMGALLAGAVLAMAGAPQVGPATWVESGIAASVLALGLCITLALRPPLLASLFVTATFGLVHGYAHGLELPDAASPLLYTVGFLLATASLHLMGVVLGYAARRHVLATRLMGGLIAAGGVGFLTLL